MTKDGCAVIAIAVLVLGCATPNKYQPGPDGGDVSPADGMSSLLNMSATVSPDGMAVAGSADVAVGGSADVSSDVTSATDAPTDAPQQAAVDAALATDMTSLLINGEKCSSGGAKSPT